MKSSEYNGDISASGSKTVAIALPTNLSLVTGIIHEGKRQNWTMIHLKSWRWQLPKHLHIDGLICTEIETRKVHHFVDKIPLSINIGEEVMLTATATVSPDLVGSGVNAAEYFLQRGFRNFATAAYQTRHTNESITAFRKRVIEEGATCSTIRHLTVGTADLEQVRQRFRKQIRLLQTPLAIFCINDRLASRVCTWCIQEGLAVPEQVTILGRGDNAIDCECSPVPISSVGPGDELIGREAARLLARIMNGEAPPKMQVLVQPDGVRTRRSTDITAIPDLRVARALRYIWDHYRDNIGPDEVAAACAIPRRSLDRHFKSSAGRTVTAEILRYRIYIAENLLRTRDATVATIAAEVGFNSSQYFNSQFKRLTGMTPLSFRKHARKTVTV